MSGQILEVHHSKHHAAYVKGSNDTLAEARDEGDYSTLIRLEKTLAFNLSGHVLHSIFWNNLSPDGSDRPRGDLAAAIEEHFGSFDVRRSVVPRCQGRAGFRLGILAWEPLSRRLIVEQVCDHHGNVGQGCTPILVFDAWDHAYYLQYKNLRPDYVDRPWDVVDWADVATTCSRSCCRWCSSAPDRDSRSPP
jgi:Fe-Mn family superoxide dismutase